MGCAPEQLFQIGAVHIIKSILFFALHGTLHIHFCTFHSTQFPRLLEVHQMTASESGATSETAPSEIVPPLPEASHNDSPTTVNSPV